MRIKIRCFLLWLTKLFCGKTDRRFNGLDSLFNYCFLYSDAARISIVAGELYHEFYDDIRFIQNLKQAVLKGAQVDVIFGPALYIETREFLSFCFSNPSNIHLYKRSKRDTSHYKIIEKEAGTKFAFIDKEHKLGIDGKKRRSILMKNDSKDYADNINEIKAAFEAKLAYVEKIPDVETLYKYFGPGKKNANGDYEGFVKRIGKGASVIGATLKAIQDHRNFLIQETRRTSEGQA